jgi:hypothetical protein
LLEVVETSEVVVVNEVVEEGVCVELVKLFHVDVDEMEGTPAPVVDEVVEVEAVEPGMRPR